MDEHTPISREAYWHKQVRTIAVLLAVWFVAGYVMSIFFVEALNRIDFGGVPFGFWMAQQGAIFVFISLILIYALVAGRLDEEAGLQEADDTVSEAGAAH